jgi:hypothetical protein
MLYYKGIDDMRQLTGIKIMDYIFSSVDEKLERLIIKSIRCSHVHFRVEGKTTRVTLKTSVLPCDVIAEKTPPPLTAAQRVFIRELFSGRCLATLRCATPAAQPNSWLTCHNIYSVLNNFILFYCFRNQCLMIEECNVKN